MKLAREGIESLKFYIPGKPIEEVRREYGLTEIIKLASNENPLGASPLAVKAMQREVEASYLYPDPTCRDLREKLADRFDVDSMQILVSNGMDNILALIAQAFLNQGEEVLTGSPTFAAYATNCAIMGGELVGIPLVNHTFDLRGMKERVSNKTKLIFICNPNNPTGTIVTGSEVEEFMNGLPEGCIVVFDEAYAEFADSPDYAQGMKYVREGRNCIVTRTFSKLYGLAGIRVGYAIAPPHIMNILKRVVEPFPVTRISQAGAIAAMDDSSFVQSTLEANAQGRDYLYEQFGKLGFESSPTYANFIWTDTHADSRALESSLLKKGIIVRPGHLWGCNTHLRVTIGTLEQCGRFIAALREILACNGKDEK